jgi:membrane protein implicated in regulation of membrane protease activity
MALSTIWWLLAGGAVALELFTGTFYLLMVALGLSAGALAAHGGLSLTGQLVSAAVVGAGAVAVWTTLRRRQPARPAAGASRDVNLDIGEVVQVESWEADGTAHVHYRGARWTAVPRSGLEPQPGAHRVIELVGNRLVLDKA